jgi:hypothetical protein
MADLESGLACKVENLVREQKAAGTGRTRHGKSDGEEDRIISI